MTTELKPLRTLEEKYAAQCNFENCWCADRNLDRNNLHERESVQMWKDWYEFDKNNEPVFPQTDYIRTRWYCRYCGSQTVVIDVYDDNYDYETGYPEHCVTCWK